MAYATIVMKIALRLIDMPITSICFPSFNASLGVTRTFSILIFLEYSQDRNNEQILVKMRVGTIPFMPNQ